MLFSQIGPHQQILLSTNDDSQREQIITLRYVSRSNESQIQRQFTAQVVADLNVQLQILKKLYSNEVSSPTERKMNASV